MGWNLTNHVGESPQNWVTPEQQATYLRQSIDWIKAEASKLNLQSVLYYQYRNTPNSGLNEASDYMGLRNEAGVFKPAWYVLEEETGVPAWPAPEWQANIDNFGHPAAGKLTSNPDISSWGPGRLDIVARGPNRELVHMAYENGWSSWETLGGTKPAELLSSAPSTASWGPYRIDMVALNDSGEILQWAYDGTKYVGPFNLGRPPQGKLTSDPEISTRGYGILDIFARGPGNKLFHMFYPNAQGGWSAWEDLGGSLAGGVGAVSWDSHRIDVFGRAKLATSEDRVAHWAWNEIGWPYDEVLGPITSDPDASSRGAFKFDLFARGPQGELVHQWYPGGWGGSWENLGGSISGAPGAASWNSERIDVVGTSPQGDLLHWGYGMPSPP
jgi:hypothetical protein